MIPTYQQHCRAAGRQSQRATREVWSAHARASVCTLLLHAPGLVSCVRQHASCQPCTQLFGSCLGFAVLKNNSLLEGLEFTPASSARTKGDIYVPGTYTNIFFLIFPFDEIYRHMLFFHSRAFFFRVNRLFHIYAITLCKLLGFLLVLVSYYVK